MNYLDAIPLKEIMPSCSIRGDCRWYIQEENGACKICSYVITEITIEELKI